MLQKGLMLRIAAVKFLIGASVRLSRKFPRWGRMLNRASFFSHGFSAAKVMFTSQIDLALARLLLVGEEI